MSSQYGELWPANGRDRFGCLGHTSKIQRVSCLGFVTAATNQNLDPRMPNSTLLSLNGSQPNFARCLIVSCAGALYIHFWGSCAVTEFLPGAKFSLRPSLALSYIGSVTARHSSTGRQPNFAALSRWRYLYSAGRPSRWALAHILVASVLVLGIYTL